jgi:hypothetical protein
MLTGIFERVLVTVRKCGPFTLHKLRESERKRLRKRKEKELRE